MAFLSYVALEDVGQEHLQRLIDDGVGEGLSLEFKRTTYEDTREAKREFLKDVTALSNSHGGHLIIGMDAADGIASAITPISDRNCDTEKQRLENLLRDGIEPGLVGVQIHEVPFSGGFVLILRIPRSWNPPHRVLMGDNGFYGRNSSGKYLMDVEQLRASFLGASELERRIQDFRTRRLSLVSKGQTPFKLKAPQSAASNPLEALRGAVEGRSRGILVLHISSPMPARMPFNPGQAIEMSRHFAPFSCRGIPDRRRPNLEGVATACLLEEDGSVGAYAQLFRNGELETAKDIALPNSLINPHRIREDLVECLPRYVEGLSSLGFGPPFFLLLSILNVRGMRLRHGYDSPGYPADRADLLFDPIRLNTGTLAGTWQTPLKPLLDALWNAFGVIASPDFDATGAWAPLRL